MTRRLPLVAALAVLLLIAAGCGSDAAEQGADAPAAPTTTSATVEPPATDEPTEEPTTPEPTSASPTETIPPPPPPPSSSPPATPPTTGTPPPGDGAPTTYAQAVARFDTFGQEPQQLSRFESPSGNLYCVIDSEYLPAACEIDKGAVRNKAYCGDGPSQYVGRIEFADGAPQAVCNSDTIREPGAPILGYTGVAGWDGSPYQCLMEEIGLTCIDTSSPRGFFLARGRYQVFSG